jgi:copper resistance protein B
VTKRFPFIAVLLAIALAPSSAQAQAQSAPPPTQASDPHAGHTMAEPADSAASPGPEIETAPPPEAGSGPPRAADAIFGGEAMAASRRELQRTHGDFPVSWFQGDRLELRSNKGADAYLWDVQGYRGGPTRRVWFKSEGEGALGGGVDAAEVQALWARAVAPFWDLQLGVRQDFAGPSTSYAVVGVQGLAPYLFEVDAALFVSHRGHVTARIEAELDQRITQRLIVQPRAEVLLAASDDRRLGIGAGLDELQLGLRLRYEFVREFAPYVGIEQRWRVGRGATYSRAAGDDLSTTSLLAGVRFWF